MSGVTHPALAIRMVARSSWCSPSIGAISTYTDSSAGAYDNVEDTQIGVLNLSGTALTSIKLTGPSGYWVERGGLVAIGELDGARTTLAEATLEAARAAERELRVGRTAADVARAIDERVERLRVRSGIWHGHGVGIDHDLPIVTAADATPLAERMAIAVHPNFSTADELLGASVADTYVVGPDEPERLSSVPQELHRR